MTDCMHPVFYFDIGNNHHFAGSYPAPDGRQSDLEFFPNYISYFVDEQYTRQINQEGFSLAVVKTLTSILR